MSEPMVRVEGVIKSFEGGRIQALRGVDLEVGPGEFLALMGPSGSGKSTLLHLIAALDRPDSGHIWVDGKHLEAMGDASDYRARTVGLIFQLHNLIASLTALENVQLPMMGVVPSLRERRERALALLERLGLADRRKSRPSELSGGERQRVAIARALANGPRLILADEPTGSVDTVTGQSILDYLRGLQRERGTTLILVTHSPQVARAADGVAYMVDGRIQREAPPL